MPGATFDGLLKMAEGMNRVYVIWARSGERFCINRNPSRGPLEAYSIRSCGWVPARVPDHQDRINQVLSDLTTQITWMAADAGPDSITEVGVQDLALEVQAWKLLS